jgi:lipopolysaccharide transport system ATP-binding protein
VADAPRTVGSLAVTLYDRYGTKLVNADTMALGAPLQLQAGHNRVQLRIDQLHLNPGLYNLGLWVADPPSEVHDAVSTAMMLEVVETETQRIRVQEDGVVPCRFELLGLECGS